MKYHKSWKSIANVVQYTPNIISRLCTIEKGLFILLRKINDKDMLISMLCFLIIINHESFENAAKRSLFKLI